MITLGSDFEKFRLFDQIYAFFFVHRESQIHMIDKGDENFLSYFDVLLTNCSHFESSDFLHLMFF